MKFWKKIYFAVFVLFLVFMNGGFFLIYYISYSHNLAEEKTRLAGEYEVVRRSLVDDISAFGGEKPSEEEFRTIMSEYESMFQKNSLCFVLWNEETCVFRSEGIDRPDHIPEDAIMIRRENGVQTAYMSTAFKVKGNAYRLAAIRSLSGLTALWNQFKLIYLLLSGIISIVLAIVLYVIMRRLTRPLRRLSEMTNKIADGEYELIRVDGKDEIAELGRDFNQMTTAVQNRIESQQRFVANLAHELRTPLTSIGGYAEYLLRGNQDPDRQFQALQYINRESRRMQQMASQLLLLARVRDEALMCSEMSVEACLREAYNSCVPLLDEKGVRVVWRGNDFCVRGVQELFVCLCRNLFENAIRACDSEGEIQVCLGDGRFDIRDNGVGMEASELDKIIEPFYRVDQARSRACGGTGLGLALCREISELHEAQMQYESEPGKGTRVTVIFTTS